MSFSGSSIRWQFYKQGQEMRVVRVLTLQTLGEKIDGEAKYFVPLREGTSSLGLKYSLYNLSFLFVSTFNGCNCFSVAGCISLIQFIPFVSFDPTN